MHYYERKRHTKHLREKYGIDNEAIDRVGLARLLKMPEEAARLILKPCSLRGFDPKGGLKARGMRPAPPIGEAGRA